MKILVMSDSHGDKRGIVKALNYDKDIKDVFYCGDGIDDIESVIPDFPNHNFYIVNGNCDFFTHHNDMEIVEIESKKFMLTHGHNYYVKSSLTNLKLEAKKQNCDFVFYGHTHEKKHEYDDGMHILNPGSIHGPVGTFAILDIRDTGILHSFLNLHKI